MATAREHYDRLLAPHYSRLFGDFEAKVAEQQTLLARLGVAPRASRVAVDLGAGPGFQSIALARLGFEVVAIDASERLLAELRARGRGLPVQTVAGDIRDLEALAPAAAEVVVCMGDTLPHLEAASEVVRLLAAIRSRLAPGGRVVLTFRDLSAERRELDRFVPVHAADDLIVTCFLEYEPETVKVHDLVWHRDGGGWQLETGAYRKLRLAAAAVAAQLEAAGFTVTRDAAPGGLTALVGVTRP